MNPQLKRKMATAVAVACSAVFCCIVLTGCAGATGAKGTTSADPTERGLSYIAAAIVTSAVLRAFFNK